MTETPADGRQHLLDVVKHFDTALLVTRAGTGELRARPMGLAEVRDDGRLFFCASLSSPKVAEIRGDDRVAVTMQGTVRFASLSGRARIETDRALIRSLWSEGWRAWFPEGKDDPDLCLVEVMPTEGEFWDNAGAKGLRFLVETATAWVTRQPAQQLAEADDQHGKVKLH